MSDWIVYGLFVAVTDYDEYFYRLIRLIRNLHDKRTLTRTILLVKRCVIKKIRRRIRDFLTYRLRRRRAKVQLRIIM